MASPRAPLLLRLLLLTAVGAALRLAPAASPAAARVRLASRAAVGACAVPAAAAEINLLAETKGVWKHHAANYKKFQKTYCSPAVDDSDGEGMPAHDPFFHNRRLSACPHYRWHAEG